MNFHHSKGRGRRLDLESLRNAVGELLSELNESGLELAPDKDAFEEELEDHITVVPEVPGLIDLTLSLSSKVIGQDRAMGAVAERVAVSFAGLKLQPERPHGVILLNGPSGTGKTTLARQLAVAAYGDAEAIIRLDMSEYSNAEDARMKLIGASRVWKNSTREGLLTTRIAEKPRSVLLLDEFEKSHSDIWPLFLQVFDDGRLTDGWGTEASFAETIIVMTTNLGSDSDDRTPESVFPPEFLGRLDVSVAFQALTPEAINAIIRKEIKESIDQIADHGWHLEVCEEATNWLTQRRSDLRLGVRGLRREIEQVLVTPLIAFEERRVRVKVRADNAGLTFEAAPPEGLAQTSS